MAITVGDVGTAVNSSGTTLVVTVGVAGVATGALIVVAVSDFVGTTTLGTVSDSKSNTYTKIGSTLLPNNSAASHGNGGVLYSYNSNALVSGDTITFNKKGTDKASMSVIYATGVKTSADPLDSSVTATSTGSGTAPSVTSGTPAEAGELLVGVVLAASNATATIPSLTQDSTNGWSNLPTSAGTSGSGAMTSVHGGNQVKATAAATTYAPTFNSASPWGEGVYGFKAGAGAASVGFGVAFPH